MSEYHQFYAHWFDTTTGPAVLMPDGRVVTTPDFSEPMRAALEERGRLGDECRKRAVECGAALIARQNENEPGLALYRKAIKAVRAKAREVIDLIPPNAGIPDDNDEYVSAQREAEELSLALTAAYKRREAARDARIRAVVGDSRVTGPNYATKYSKETP